MFSGSSKCLFKFPIWLGTIWFKRIALHWCNEFEINANYLSTHKKCNGKYPLHCLLTKIGSQASGRGLFEICQILSPSLNSFQILVMTPLKIWSPPPPSGNAAVVEKPYLKIFETRKKFPSASPISREPYFSGFMVFPWNLLLDSLFFAILLNIKIKCKKWIQNYCML